ncbi:MAG TPA: pantoate--beta-alanine ligase [Stellaceae bacterium]|nr:pantoate--beta-alanine ligase [Stellaceae bacterium]
MTDWAPERIGGLAVVRTVADLRRVIAAWHRAGERVALVPTMGALHRGHLALVEHGRRVARHTVASIFVNPTQFAPTEDFARYPRDEAGDAAKLAGAFCDLLYAPGVDEMYPTGFAATVTAGPIAEGQDGRFRPSHFPGVATVVTKLLLQSRADVACFGEKDYQQLQVIRHVVRDLDIPTRIDGVPTVREPDGLALSSRNVYLTAAERAIAPALHRTLLHAAERIETGAATIAAATAEALAALARTGFARIDYFEVCDAETLMPLTTLGRPGRVLAAAWLGRTRLIDNVALGVGHRA